VIPGIILMWLLWWGVPDVRPEAISMTVSSLAWKHLDHRVRALVLAAGGLAFAAVPDVFLVLWASSKGVAVVWIPLLWAVAHGIRSIVAGYGGALSDTLGRMPVVITGWLCRIALLILLALSPANVVVTGILFLVYAAATAFTEGAERALIGDFAPAGQKATAFGWYHMLSGLLVLPGAILFGALWQWISMPVAFMISAALTAIAAATLVMLGRDRHSFQE
jgi:hypothetical protein